MQSKFSLITYTDHSPLTWVKYTSGRGPVSQFVIDNLSIIDYEIRYIKGEENVVADALSRFPMLGPRTLDISGVTNALHIIMSGLTTTNVNLNRLWFNAQKDTSYLIQHIHEWIEHINSPKNKCDHDYTNHQCYMDNITERNIQNLKYSMAILIPPADNITNLCKAIIKKKIPFACLIPNTLIHQISQNNDGTYDKNIQQEVDNCQKIVLLAPELTWCVFGISDMNTKTVFVNDMANEDIQNEIDRYHIDMTELYKNLSENDPFPGTPVWGTREDWIPKQDQVIHLYDQTKIRTDDDGLRYYQENEDSRSLIIVPIEYQRPLIVWHHRHLCHMAPGKLWNHLRKKYHFHYMLTTIKKIVKGCRLCNVLKKRHNLAHKHFRAKLEQTPRTSYGADFISVAKTKHGFTQIIGIIDLSTGNLILRALRKRDEKSTARVIFYDLITKKGVPMLFHSDVAGELLEGVSKMLAVLLGIKQTSTKGHNPQANAKMERVWAYVGNCLKTIYTCTWTKCLMCGIHLLTVIQISHRSK